MTVIGWIEVVVVRAEGLPAVDRNFLGRLVSSDPFVKVSILEQSMFTSVVTKNLNPTWNEKLTLFISNDHIENPDTHVTFDVYDYNHTTDHFIGKCFFPLSDIIFNTQAQELKLTIIKSKPDVAPRNLRGDSVGNLFVTIMGTRRDMHQTSPMTQIRGKSVTSSEAVDINNILFVDYDSKIDTNTCPAVIHTKLFKEIRAHKKIQDQGMLEACKARLIQAYKSQKWRKNVNQILAGSNEHKFCSKCGKEKKPCILCSTHFCHNCYQAWFWIGKNKNTEIKIEPLTQEKDTALSTTFQVCIDCDEQLNAKVEKKEEVPAILQVALHHLPDLDPMKEQILAEAECIEIFTSELMENPDKHQLKRLTDKLEAVRIVHTKYAKAVHRFKTVLMKEQTSSNTEIIVRNNIILALATVVESVNFLLNQCKIRASLIEAKLAREQEYFNKARRIRNADLMKGVLLVKVKGMQNLGKLVRMWVFSANEDVQQEISISREADDKSHPNKQVVVPIHSVLDKVSLHIHSSLTICEIPFCLYTPEQQSEEDSNPKSKALFSGSGSANEPLRPMFPSRQELDKPREDIVPVKVGKSDDAFVHLRFEFVRMDPVPSYMLGMFNPTRMWTDEAEREHVNSGPGVLFVTVHGGQKFPTSELLHSRYCRVSLRKKHDESFEQFEAYRTITDTDIAEPKWNLNKTLISNEGMKWCFETVLSDYQDMELMFTVVAEDSHRNEDFLNSYRAFLPIDPNGRMDHALKTVPNGGIIYVSVYWRPITVDKEGFVSQIYYPRLQENVPPARGSGTIKTVTKGSSGGIGFLGKMTSIVRGSGDDSGVISFRGSLELDIIKARDLELSHSDIRGKVTLLAHGVDPYVNVIVGSKKMFATQVIHGTNNPAWNESFTLQINDSLKQRIFIEVKFKSLLGIKNHFVGKFELLYLSDHCNIESKWIPVGGDTQGEICITTRFTPKFDLELDLEDTPFELIEKPTEEELSAMKIE
eukprot:m.342294 g.342294  ORF g.342294 m.342294 type:complete len:985 (-) comp21206_c0_seq1:54-3008(-)